MSVSSASLKRAKFIFDLNGYFLVKNVLSESEVTTARNAVLNHANDFKERKGDVQRNTTGAEQEGFSGDGSTGRFDLGGILNWKDGEIFRKFMCHEKIVPYLHMILGEGYRLDHSPFIIKQVKGSEGFNLHGGPERDLQYSVVHGEISTSLLGAVVFINKQTKEDGGYCVVKGSHKMNFPMDASMKNGADAEFFRDHVSPVAADPGDVLLFSEATVHGALAWTNAERERLIGLYRFSPATVAYARGYLDHGLDTSSWTEREKAVLQPPFSFRFDRNLLDENDSTVTKTKPRSREKKDFDKEVFGRSYY